MPRPGRIWRLIAGSFFLVPGLGLCLFALSYDGYRYLLGTDAKTWPVAIGRVEAHGVRDVEGRRSWYNPRRRYDPANVTTDYEPVIAYSYVVGDRRYRGERIWLIGRPQRWETPEQVDHFVAGLRPQALPVRYNPADPADAALILHSGIEPGFWTSLASVPIGLGFAWIGWTVMRPGRRKAVTSA